jgi:phospholipid/cholesterol/gamma-HCH transport system permease protein
VTAAVGRLGGATARRLSRLGALARFGVGALRSGARLTAGGRHVALRVTLHQIRFTAVDAVGLVVLLSGILSFLVISQAVRELGRYGATDLIGTLMVVAIVRELGPLITALTVVGRSGTAIAAELATNQVLGEVRALEAIGIDPRQYLVLPRFVGSLAGLFVLLVVFDVVAIATGFAAASLNGMSGARYAEIVLHSLALGDVWLTVAIAIAFGLIVGIVPSYYGLTVEPAPTAIPIAASRATVASIVGIFLCSAMFVAIRVSR